MTCCWPPNHFSELNYLKPDKSYDTRITKTAQIFTPFNYERYKCISSEISQSKLEGVNIPSVT